MSSRPLLSSEQAELLRELVDWHREESRPVIFRYQNPEFGPEYEIVVADSGETILSTDHNLWFMLKSLEDQGLISGREDEQLTGVGIRVPTLVFQLCQASFEYVDWLKKPRVTRWFASQWENTSRREVILVLVSVILACVLSIIAQVFGPPAVWWIRSQFFHSPIP